MSDRNPEHLDPELRRRMHCSMRDHRNLYPAELQPIISETHRGEAAQAEKWAQGRSKPGRIVTRAEPGESPHNQMPSAACDVAFPIPGTRLCDWSVARFKRLAEITARYGIEWSGDWKEFHESDHFQVPGWRHGKGHSPWPPMPEEPKA
jgi:peptidoglycan L-alanyl-D-glutamate endopeptidase CwlK